MTVSTILDPSAISHVGNHTGEERGATANKAVMSQRPRVWFLFVVSSLALVCSEQSGPRCCKIGESLDWQVSLCSPEEGAAPTVPDCILTPDGSLILDNVSYNFTWNHIKCNTYKFDYPHRISKNGSVHRDGHPTNSVLCLENFRNPTSGENGTLPRSMSAVFDVPSGEKYWLYATGFFLSVPFSLATLLTFALLKELESLHGSIVVRYMLCHIVSCIIIGLVDLQVIPTTMGYLCTTTGYAVQFFFTSTFFWLNVMCFDIYRTFRGFQHPRTRSKDEIRRKIFKYSSYAFFAPLAILTITVFMDRYPGVPKRSIFKPSMGIGKCFFKEKEAKWIYFYSPIAMIIVSDIYMFSATSYRIDRQRKESRVLNTLDSKRHNATDDQDRFIIYLKLFIMMGIKWVLELLSSIFYDNNVLWYTLDFANAIEGVFFFSILVWNRRVRKLLWHNLSNCFGRTTVSSQINKL